jgi:hypothetical protein
MYKGNLSLSGISEFELVKFSCILGTALLTFSFRMRVASLDRDVSIVQMTTTRVLKKFVVHSNEHSKGQNENSMYYYYVVTSTLRSA